MKPVVRHSYNVIRTIIVTAIVAVIAVYALLYVLLSVPAVQNKIKTYGEKELSQYLKTDVAIGDISIRPFNQLILYDVKIPDQQGRDMLAVEKLGAGIKMRELLFNRRIVFSYAQLIGLHGHITRKDKKSPPNIQFIIDALKSKDNKPPKKFDIAVHNIVIRKSDISYDVLSEPRLLKFDKNHVKISDLRADIDLPKLKNNDFKIEVKRLSFNEKSGFVISDFASSLSIDSVETTASNILIRLPGTVLTPNDFSVKYDSIKNIGKAIKKLPVHLVLKNNAITPSDFKSFVPALAKFKDPFLVTAFVDGTQKELRVSQLKVLSSNKSLALDMNGTLYHLDKPSEVSFHIPRLKLDAAAADISALTSDFVKLKPGVKSIISSCGDVHLQGATSGSKKSIVFNGDINTSLGKVNLVDAYVQRQNGLLNFGGQVFTHRFAIGKLLHQTDKLGEVAVNSRVKASVQGKKLLNGNLQGKIPFVDFKGYRYHNIVADVKNATNSYKGSLSIDDPNGKLNATGNVIIAGKNSRVNLDLLADHFNLSKMKLIRNNDNIVSLKMKASFAGNKFDNATGSLDVSDVTYELPSGKTYNLKGLNLVANNAGTPQKITLSSDFVQGTLEGKFDFATLIPSVKGILASVFPDVFGQFAKYANSRSANNFNFKFNLDPTDEFASLVKLPFKILYKTTVSGQIDVPGNKIDVSFAAPYLLQGKNIIEGTSAHVMYDSESQLHITVNTLFPSKNGKIAIHLNALGVNNRIDSNIGWKYNREHDFHGNIITSALLSRDENKSIQAHVDINPSEIVVNDTVWNVQQGSLDYAHRLLQVDSLHITHDKQFISVLGKVSKDPSDELTLQIKDINLDYIFETLNISNVKFGGHGTGTFFASSLLSKNPRLETPDLHIDSMKYNDALMGDADIQSHWDNENKAVAINCDLSQGNGRHSRIDGAIFPSRDSLYFDFKPDGANVEFMKPFMAAFTSDVKGLASGHAVLLGNFHDIDLYGDLFVEDLMFKLDFSNVYYSCTDSIHMRPGLIKFNKVKIKDRDKHEALMTGWVSHNHFHAPSFNFTITDAHDLLCYDTNASINPVWYGTIYGNGSAVVNGAPGVVNIKVNMQSAPRSKFTFVLSDSESASEYNFITYRDRNQVNVPVDTVAPVGLDTIPEIVKLLTRKITNQQESIPTKYKIDLQGDITPDLQMTLVMDPVGGDKIRATGTGNLRMTYDNSDERLEMYGKYTLEKGNYNFTLQDIIIKDFTIKDGSSISFQGDPYKANLDIEAIYSLNANIKDLDASFASDREINRTNVPVHALLKARGEMSQPDISFDLEFPTLTSEAYRKIKSIISTEDMMNRQIIYLLALNRFYTPDYMNNSSSNNELSSVASSTISSQLSNILGQINENWSISPNFRTEKGDFSDMEVDLALSSQLLNNRLLFNGNFGYRDNTFNSKNSNFIGDFDIEYLLNQKGTLRLKAYNHFNDQNYFYVRNAMTTQGVGLMFKHDFDKWFDFMKRKRKPRVDTLYRSTQSSLIPDTIK